MKNLKLGDWIEADAQPYKGITKCQFIHYDDETRHFITIDNNGVWHSHVSVDWFRRSLTKNDESVIAPVMTSVCDHYFNTYVNEHDKVIVEPCEFCGDVKHTEA